MKKFKVGRTFSFGFETIRGITTSGEQFNILPDHYLSNGYNAAFFRIFLPCLSGDTSPRVIGQIGLNQ